MSRVVTLFLVNADKIFHLIIGHVMSLFFYLVYYFHHNAFNNLDIQLMEELNLNNNSDGKLRKIKSLWYHS